MIVVISTHDCFYFEAKQMSFLLIPVVSGSCVLKLFKVRFQGKPGLKYASFTLT